MSNIGARFYCKNVAVLAAAEGVPQWVYLADPAGPPVYFSGMIWRNVSANFVAVFRSTEQPSEYVGYNYSATPANNFPQPIRLENADLRTVQVGSFGTAGGEFTLHGTIV